jgi:hypothetical protein
MMCLSEMTLADGGTGSRLATTSEENWLSGYESAKKAGVHWYACMLHNCTPLALWKTSSGTEAAPVVALTFLADRVFLETEEIIIQIKRKSNQSNSFANWYV